MWKVGADLRCGNLANSWSEEGDSAEAVAHPDFLGTRVEVEGHLLGYLRIGITWRKYFYTDFRASRETASVPELGKALARRPGYVGRFNAIGRGDRALAENGPARHERSQKVSNFNLEASVLRCGRRAHDDMSVAVSFDSTFHTREFRFIE